MKNIFIINPNAGSTRKGEKLMAQIHAAEKKTGMECEIYFTKHGGDGSRYIREVCTGNSQEKYRFFGAGGDGTLNEVFNACQGMDNAIAGIIPTGTGNDFVRIFHRMGDFLNLEKQLRDNSIPVVLIRCSFIVEGEKKILYCGNMVNIGFDSNVVEKAAEIHKKSPVNGSAAYLLGVVNMLVKKKGADLKIWKDGELIHDGELLLTAVANGNYCGGGVKSSPQSQLDDGIVELSIIRDMSRSRFVTLFPSYSKGTHLRDRRAEKYIRYEKAGTVRICTNSEKMIVSVDGEILYLDEIEMEVVEKAVRFSVPAEK